MPSPTEKLTKMAFFLALALVFHLIEAILIPPLPLVGVRLGLANVVTLAALELYGASSSLAISILRVLLGSFLTATFGTTAFWLSLAGAMASLMVMGLLARVQKPKFGFLGLSIAGAMSHNWAQLLTYSLLASFSGFSYYLVLLAGAAIPTGMVVAYLTYQLCRLEGRRGRC